MHRLKYFPDTVPKSVRNLFPHNLPEYGMTHNDCTNWLDNYGGLTFRPSVFFKGPLLAISDTNKEILTDLSSLFSLNIYKAGAKRKLLEQQSMGDDDSWPSFLLQCVKGLRHSDRLKMWNITPLIIILSTKFKPYFTNYGHKLGMKLKVGLASVTMRMGEREERPEFLILF